MSLTQEEETKNEFVRRLKEGRQIAQSAGNNTHFLRAIIPDRDSLRFPEYEFEASTGEKIIASNVWELREKLAIVALQRIAANVHS